MKCWTGIIVKWKRAPTIKNINHGVEEGSSVVSVTITNRRFIILRGSATLAGFNKGCILTLLFSQSICYCFPVAFLAGFGFFPIRLPSGEKLVDPKQCPCHFQWPRKQPHPLAFIDTSFVSIFYLRSSWGVPNRSFHKPGPSISAGYLFKRARQLD